MIKFFKKIRDIYLVRIKWRKYEIGSGFHSGRSVFIWGKKTIKIGNNFYIGRYSEIACDVQIGDNVIFANHVTLVGRYDHHYQQVGVPVRLASQIRDVNYDWKGLHSKIVIEDDVWVGFGSILVSGIKIGQGSIIAAGSVVTNDVEPYSIYGGVPAKKIRNRYENEEDLKEHIRLYNLTYKK